MRPFVIAAFLISAVAASGETASPSPSSSPSPAPAAGEFVTQALEPTGGSIQRPKEWFYNEYHKGTFYTWLLSREDPSKGDCTTAVRIQTLLGVKAKTGKWPKEYVQAFLASRKKVADKVIKTEDEKVKGLFTMVRMETVEGGSHVLYSAFWGNGNLDVAVVSTAGTSKKLWGKYAATFDTMSDFELIDVKRYEKPPALELTAAQLVGHWRYTDTEKKVSNDYTFKEDGTYTSNIMQEGSVVWETAGKWTLKGDLVNYELTSSSSEQFPGGIDQDKVVEVTKDYYMVDSGNGEKRKYERVP